jgi:hypothetical protein
MCRERSQEKWTLPIPCVLPRSKWDKTGPKLTETPVAKNKCWINVCPFNSMTFQEPIKEIKEGHTESSTALCLVAIRFPISPEKCVYHAPVSKLKE